MATYATEEELQNLQQQLESWADELGLTLNELKAVLEARIDKNVSDIQAAVDQIKSNQKAIYDIIELDENGVTSLAEMISENKDKVQILNDILTKDGQLATDLLDKIDASLKRLQALEEKVNGIDSKIDELDESIKVKTEELSVSINELSSTTAELDSKIATISAKQDNDSKELSKLVEFDKSLFTHTDESGNEVEGEVDKRIREANASQSAVLRDEIKIVSDNVDELMSTTLKNSEKIAEHSDKLSKLDSEIYDRVEDGTIVEAGLITRTNNLEITTAKLSDMVVANSDIIEEVKGFAEQVEVFKRVDFKALTDRLRVKIGLEPKYTNSNSNNSSESPDGGTV